MNFNKKFIGIGLGLLLMVWIGNVFYYEKHMLKEPIFMKHYYDLEKGRGNFELHYIQNINESQKIARISFPEIEREYPISNGYECNSDGRYYAMKCAMVDIHRADMGKIFDGLKNKVITKAEIYFSNGKIKNVDLGKIYLYHDREEKSNMHASMNSASSDNTGSASFTADKDLKIKRIYCKFSDVVQVNVNSKILQDVNFPLELKTGDALDINYSFKFKEGDIRRNYVYDFPLYIVTEDFQGNKGLESCYMHYYLQFPQQLDINAMIKHKDGD